MCPLLADGRLKAGEWGTCFAGASTPSLQPSSTAARPSSAAAAAAVFSYSRHTARALSIACSRIHPPACERHRWCLGGGGGGRRRASPSGRLCQTAECEEYHRE